MTKMLAVLGILLMTASFASADCGCAAVAPVAYGPTPMVVNYGPVAPVAYTAYAYPGYGYGYAYPAPYVVARPVVAVPGPVVYGPVYGPAVVYRAPYYARPWLYVPGQPVRNTLRATFR